MPFKTTEHVSTQERACLICFFCIPKSQFDVLLMIYYESSRGLEILDFQGINRYRNKFVLLL